MGLQRAGHDWVTQLNWTLWLVACGKMTQGLCYALLSIAGGAVEGWMVTAVHSVLLESQAPQCSVLVLAFESDIGGTSLVVQWLRLCLPVQGMKIWSWVGEPRSHGPCGQKSKTLNRSNIVPDAIKTYKRETSENRKSWRKVRALEPSSWEEDYWRKKRCLIERRKAFDRIP